MKKILMCVFISVFLVTFASMAMATPITISGSAIPGDYTLAGPGGGAVPVTVTLPASPWAAGSWMAPSSDQRWIPPTPNGNEPGDYTYSTTFSLAGLLPSTAVLIGNWATDDTASVDLNGNPVGTIAGYSPTQVFSISSGFVAGINTLTFLVHNSPYNYGNGDLTANNPTGLLVNFTSATADPVGVPEPTTLLLLGFGLVGLAGVRRKSQR